MCKILKDYEESGMSSEEAYTKFWEDVRQYDPSDYDSILGGRTLNEAVGNGLLDELRADYLRTLDIDCHKIMEV
jgi:hypothetical protein